MLRSYFDGSTGFPNNDSAPRVLALACVAAETDFLERVEGRWNSVLKQRGNPSHMHMVDAMTRNGSFIGWTVEDRDFLLDSLAQVLLDVQNDPRIQSFAARVDLEAYRHVKLLRSLPSPERICARIVFPHVLEWHYRTSRKIYDTVEVYFDRNEPFMRHVRADWTSSQIRRERPHWNLVKKIEEASSQSSPAMQMADMICWGNSRLGAGTRWDTQASYDVHCRAVKSINLLRGKIIVFGERELLTVNFREEGYEAINRQQRRARA